MVVDEKKFEEMQTNLARDLLRAAQLAESFAARLSSVSLNQSGLFTRPEVAKNSNSGARPGCTM